MTKCAYCGYKIEGHVYLVKFITEFESDRSICKECGKLHKQWKNNSKVRVCGLCYLNFEEKADGMGYAQLNIKGLDTIDIHGLKKSDSELITEMRGRPVTVQLLGKRRGS